MPVCTGVVVNRIVDTTGTQHIKKMLKPTSFEKNKIQMNIFHYTCHNSVQQSNFKLLENLKLSLLFAVM